MKKTIFILFVIIFAVALAGCSERISFENYTVSFDSMGGSAVPESAFSSIKTCPEPLKDGYVFEGWYEESDFSSKMVQFPYEATKNVTLYAKYIDIKTGNEEIKYALEGDVAVAVTYTGSSKNVVVPDFFEGKSVVKVSSGFVKNINSISRFYFGSELKSIEEKFFIFPNFEEFVLLGKNEFFSVIDGILYSGTGDAIICFPRAKAPADGAFFLPEKVESIVKNAFRYADNIKVLNFGKNVRVIEEKFSYLSSLERINADNEFFLSDDGVLYDASGKNLIACPPNRVGSYTLIDSAERILDGALNGCRLEKLTVNAALADFGTQESMSGMKGLFCDGNPIYSAIDGVLYDVVSKKIVAYPADKEG
ncbi:MAG: InlB B-repeat-containing protein, partial [Christensenellales bacterium]